MSPFAAASALLAVTGLALSGCAAASPADDAPPAGAGQAKPGAEVASAERVPALVVRLRGGPDLAIRREGENYFSGRCRITTPLPEGYPDPTPPGAIELKRYPSVRRAEVSGAVAPDLGMNVAFFPLFSHIKGRNIAMTAPVEMDYRSRPTGQAGGMLKGDQAAPAPAQAPVEGEAEKPAEWTMSFLYRSKDLGPTGADEQRKNVRVVDAPALTVVSLGIRGTQAFGRVQEHLAELRGYLAAQAIFEPAGDPRGLYYNGPDVPEGDKWGEVQIPVRLAGSGTANEPAATPAAEDAKSK